MDRKDSSITFSDTYCQQRAVVLTIFVTRGMIFHIVSLLFIIEIAEKNRDNIAWEKQRIRRNESGRKVIYCNVSLYT